MFGGMQDDASITEGVLVPGLLMIYLPPDAGMGHSFAYL